MFELYAEKGKLYQNINDSLEEDLRAFQFQAKPRINRINEQLTLLQQHLENSPLNKTTK